MSDFDYDELDKAMQSLDGDEPQEASDISDNNTADPVEKPILETVGAHERAPLPSLAARRTGGRFMDVVHPSSDMRSPIKPVVPAEPISTPTTVSVNESPVEEPVPAPVEMPDPIELDQPTPEPKPVDDAGEDDDIEKLSQDINKTLGIASDKSLETPFIPNVPVDKRPLGTFSNSEDSSSVPDNEVPIKDMPVESNSSAEVSTDTPLPAELRSDLLSIESSTAVKNNLPEVSQPKPDDNGKAEEADIIPTMSTPHQLQAKPGTDDQKTSPMYESATSYGKALLHPAKSKSWMWIIWIAVLIIVGAGIGVAAYFILVPGS